MKTPAPDWLEQVDRKRIHEWNWSERGPGLSDAHLTDLMDECLNYHGARCEGCGDPKCKHEFASWPRAVMNWIRKGVQYEPEKYRRTSRPKSVAVPEPQDHSGEDMVEIGNVVDLLTKEVAR